MNRAEVKILLLGVPPAVNVVLFLLLPFQPALAIVLILMPLWILYAYFVVPAILDRDK